MSMPKSIILYAVRPDRVLYPNKRYQTVKVGQFTIKIRGQIVNADVATALDKAKPLPNEVVLNTIPISGA